MSTPTRLVLWRHGQTDWNLASRFQGQTDVPLNFTGIAQAQEAARRVAALHPDAIVSSPLGRTTATADALAELTQSLGLRPEAVNRAQLSALKFADSLEF